VALTVLPVASRALVDACHRLGLETDHLLEEAGLTRAALEDPDARLLASQADALWMAAAGAGTWPSLPLQAAAATPFGAFRVLDYLDATGPTLGDGLGRVADYFPLVDPRGLLRVKAGATRVELLFTAADGGPLPPPAQEYTLAVLFHRARLAMAGELRPVEVRFAFPRPADPREHERAFGLMPRFGAPEAGLVFTRGDWERPTRMTDPGLFTVLEEQSAFTQAFRRWTGRSPTAWTKGRADTRKRRHRGNSGGAA
jgi:AraC-like DNA-binding protein